MGVLSTFEREPSCQVLSKAWDSLDGWKELCIHTFLVFLAFIRHYIVLDKNKQSQELDDTTTSSLGDCNPSLWGCHLCVAINSNPNPSNVHIKLPVHSW